MNIPFREAIPSRSIALSVALELHVCQAGPVDDIRIPLWLKV